MFAARITWPGFSDRLLKSGHNSRKIGKIVTKGRLKGYPIYTLTLEERATCPNSCQHWRDCYGNKMNWSERLMAGPALEWRLGAEIAALQQKHPEGFLVRLHVLGDFYSTEYVRLWLSWLRRFPALHVFGYTAWPTGTPIGALLRDASDRLWGRFSIRHSNAALDERSTDTATDTTLRGRTALGVVCPAQTGGSDCCATCGLCWQSRENIVFLLH